MLTRTLARTDPREDAFTLVELLVVILIIGVLAAIAVPAFLNQRSAAQETALKSDVKNAGILLEGQKKFTGALDPNTKISQGVFLTAMRTAEKDNKVSSSQFVDGNDTNWRTYTHPSQPNITANTEVRTNPGDGYQGMNYRRITTAGTGVNQQVGQYVYITLPQATKKGDQFTVGFAMRHNYSGDRLVKIEFKKDPQTSSWPGGTTNNQATFTSNQWSYHTFTGTAAGDGAGAIVLALYDEMVPGQVFDVTGAVIVKGDKIDPAAALDASGSDFCVQGYHEADPSNIWRYSSLDGGLQHKAC